MRRGNRRGSKSSPRLAATRSPRSRALLRFTAPTRRSTASVGHQSQNRNRSAPRTFRASIKRSLASFPKATFSRSNCEQQTGQQPVASAPSPHWQRDFLRGHGCGERAGVRGLERAVWPPHPHPLPRKTHTLKAQSIAGERGQTLTAGYFCDAHSRSSCWSRRHSASGTRITSVLQ